MDSPKPKRRWFRFSLRTLLIFTLLVALLMGWIAKERRQSQFEHEIAGNFKPPAFKAVRVDFRGPFDSELAKDQSWWRTQLGNILGTRVSFLAFDDDSINDVAPLAHFKSLRILVIDSSQVRDITPLAGLENLERLFIGGTQVSDLTPIFRFKKLRELNYPKTKVKEDQVEALKEALPHCMMW